MQTISVVHSANPSCKQSVATYFRTINSRLHEVQVQRKTHLEHSTVSVSGVQFSFNQKAKTKILLYLR